MEQLKANVARVLELVSADSLLCFMENEMHFMVKRLK